MSCRHETGDIPVYKGGYLGSQCEEEDLDGRYADADENLNGDFDSGGSASTSYANSRNNNSGHNVTPSEDNGSQDYSSYLGSNNSTLRQGPLDGGYDGGVARGCPVVDPQTYRFGDSTTYNPSALHHTSYPGMIQRKFPSPQKFLDGGNAEKRARVSDPNAFGLQQPFQTMSIGCSVSPARPSNSRDANGYGSSSNPYPTQSNGPQNHSSFSDMVQSNSLSGQNFTNRRYGEGRAQGTDPNTSVLQQANQPLFAEGCFPPSPIASPNIGDPSTTSCGRKIANNTKRQLCTDYQVAWICPVADVELLPARLMLDEEHLPPKYDARYDENTYVFGAINGHAVVIATCPQGLTGNVNAGHLTGAMFKSFRNIRVAVLVGIGGGIPRHQASDDPLKDVHLGDVIVGWPGDHKPACVYYNRGRLKVDGQFEIVGRIQDPDWRVGNALSILASDHELGQTRFGDHLARLLRHKDHKKFAHPGLELDKLYKPQYRHIGTYWNKCISCDPNELVKRSPRTEDDMHTLVFHQGRIATGDAVIQDGEIRDKIRDECDGALCVEMEAAGVDANRRCLVIRGISDYADSHKNDIWRSYAAGNAAAFTRELLCKIQPDVVKGIEEVTNVSFKW